jgi:hypothetical protein
MKSLASVVLAGLLSVSVAACAKDEPKAVKAEEATVVQVAQAAPVNPQVTDAVTAPKKEEPVYKTVCLDVQGKDGKPVIDQKTGKPKQNCTKVRVRQKFEGTAIDSAPKK